MKRIPIAATLWLVLAGSLAQATEVPVAPKASTAVAVTPDAAQAEEEATNKRVLDEAQALLKAGQAANALPLLDEMIARYEARYPEGRTRWYVSRDTSETLAYLVLAAVGQDAGKSDAVNAQALTVQWANAWYLKGYTLVELKRLPEARAALEKAIALSPYNSTYLTELAEISKLERDWDAAFALYERAEDAAAFSPEAYQVQDRAQALRGQAFVHIEKGELARAVKVLEACLKLDPDDARAKEELEYIAKLRAAKKS